MCVLLSIIKYSIIINVYSIIIDPIINTMCAMIYCVIQYNINVCNSWPIQCKLMCVLMSNILLMIILSIMWLIIMCLQY